VVIQIQAIDEQPRPRFAGAIGFFLLDVMWSVPNVPMNPDRDKIRVTTVRVKLADGSQKDVRMEGQLTGVNVSLGDLVSFWGSNYRGLLLFSKGFNHTAQGLILTSRTDDSSKGTILFVIAIILLLVVAFTSGWLHWHWPPWTS
jgi:hypothetical protein